MFNYRHVKLKLFLILIYQNIVIDGHAGGTKNNLSLIIKLFHYWLNLKSDENRNISISRLCNLTVNI